MDVGAFPLVVLMGVLFVPAGEVLGGEWIVGFWGGSRTEFGQGLPCLEIIFSLAILLDDPFGP